MAALFDEVVSSLGDRRTVRSMAEESPGADVPSLGTAAVLGVPLIISRLTHSLADQGVSQVVLDHLGSIDPVAQANSGPAADAVANKAAGDQIIDLIFGDGRSDVANAIALETGISDGQAAMVLPTSAWTVLSSVVKQYGNQLDNPSLVTVLDRERRDLMSKGWAQWIDKVSPLAPAIDTASRAAESPAVSPPPVASASAPAPAVPPPVSARHADLMPDPSVRDYEPAALGGSHGGRADLSTTSVENDLDRLGAASLGSGGGAASARSITTERSERALSNDDDLRRPRERQPSNKRISVLSLIAGALLMLGVLALIGWLQSRGGSDTNVADGSEIATSADEAGAADTDTEESTDGGTAGASEGADEAATDGETSQQVDGDTNEGTGSGEPQLVYSIEMNDPLQRSDAQGVIDLTFDPDAGEVCYAVETTGVGTPYDGHIHVGPAGVKGSIVVDFGPVTSGQPGCTAIAANDMTAILTQPSVHYVEMHDPSEDFTIRAQMSDEPMPVIGGSVDFNPDGDGAMTMISAGRIVLDGPVPDQETMDRMIAEVAGLDESRILVVNDLVVTEGADLPTGLITVADSILFDVDSDQLGADNAVIEDLALLFAARQDWTMTIVGHTDNTGGDVYNLELSLRRATAVRDSLVGLGIDAERLRAEGAGATNPVAGNDTEEDRAQNRRIEFRIDRS